MEGVLFYKLSDFVGKVLYTFHFGFTWEFSFGKSHLFPLIHRILPITSNPKVKS